MNKAVLEILSNRTAFSNKIPPFNPDMLRIDSGGDRK